MASGLIQSLPWRKEFTPERKLKKKVNEKGK